MSKSKNHWLSEAIIRNLFFISTFFITSSILYGQGEPHDDEVEQTFEYIYDLKYSEFEDDLIQIGFDSLYRSNNYFRKFVKWNRITREELYPHNNFLTKYELDENYFNNYDEYPVSEQSCQWRELGPINQHDWDWGTY